MVPGLGWIFSLESPSPRILLPAALGDASLANLPPEVGLYACLFGGLGLLDLLRFALHRRFRYFCNLARDRLVAWRDYRR